MVAFVTTYAVLWCCRNSHIRHHHHVFHFTGQSSSSIASSSLENKVQPLPEGLPEGFMDDPVMDAKVSQSSR